MKFADVVVPRGAENHVAIDLIATHIANMLRSRSELHRARLTLSSPGLSELPSGVSVLPYLSVPPWFFGSQGLKPRSALEGSVLMRATV